MFGLCKLTLNPKKNLKKYTSRKNKRERNGAKIIIGYKLKVMQK